MGEIHSCRGNSPQDCGWEKFSVHLLSRDGKKASSHLSQPKGQNVMLFLSTFASAWNAAGDASKSTARGRSFCGVSIWLVDFYDARHVFFHRDGQRPASGTLGNLNRGVRDHFSERGLFLQSELGGIDFNLD